MIAAFCELLSVVRNRIVSSPSLVSAEVPLSAQEFHRVLVTQLIDDSQGLHKISEAYLNDIFYCLRKEQHPDRDELQRLLDRFEELRGVY